MAKRKIIWSRIAKTKLFEILDFYTERNKNKKYSVKLYKKFTDALKLLQKHPDIGKRTDMDSVRGIIVGDYILFYESTKDSLFVHVLWDTRQNHPDKLEIK
jgi:plasmid stabilization system protein ParE